MKYFKHPKRMKWIAALLAIVTGVVCTCSAFATLLTFEIGLYDRPLDTILSNYYQTIQEYYAIKIYNSHKNGTESPVLDNMEYGIVTMSSDDEHFKHNLNISEETGSLSEDEPLKLLDPEAVSLKQFSTHTFKETTPNASSYQKSFLSQNHYHVQNMAFLPTLFGHSYIYASDKTEKTYNEEILSMAYNKDDGLFYFVTKTYSLPVLELKIPASNLKSRPGVDKSALDSFEKFHVENYFNAKTTPDYNIKRTDKIEPSNTDNIYLSSSNRCEALDTKAYRSWQAIYINSYKFPTSQIEIVTSEELAPIVCDRNTNFYTIDKEEYNNEKNRYQTVSIPYLSYQVAQEITGYGAWFVSNIKENIDTGSNDLFATAHTYLSLTYNLRYAFIVIALIAGIICMISLALINLAIRQEKNTGILTTSFWHRIPLFVYLCGMGAFILGGGILIIYLLESAIFWASIGAKAAFFLAFLCLTAAGTGAVIVFMNLVTRYHGKIFWKYTIASHIVSICKRIWRAFLEHSSLMLKATLIYIILCIGVFFYTAITTDSFELTILLMMCFIIVSAPIYYCALLQLVQLQEGAKRLAEGRFNEKIDTRKMLWEFKKHGEYMNKVNDGMAIAIQEQLKSERFRTELITNVSHDIKTPLTSIINYIDLLQKENITEVEHKEYLEVLERQSARLKKLIEDLMEASKASTGNLTVNLEECDIDILLTQTTGEFEEKLGANNLELIIKKQEQPICIQADNRHLWRIFDNLMNNICKYAQPGTRVYINQEFSAEHVKIIFLNTSKYALNISGDELMERFVRGDSSRNTEGSGLGLSIARSLAELMHGTLEIIVEGDLFKVVLTFPKKLS